MANCCIGTNLLVLQQLVNTYAVTLKITPISNVLGKFVNEEQYSVFPILNSSTS